MTKVIDYSLTLEAAARSDDYIYQRLWKDVQRLGDLTDVPIVVMVVEPDYDRSLVKLLVYERFTAEYPLHKIVKSMMRKTARRMLGQEME
jgi:hypothetical protein